MIGIKKSYEQIVAPLEKIKAELLALQTRNLADNEKTFQQIDRLNQEVYERNAENERAYGTFQKISNLLGNP
jgi:hypothetical protein